MTEDEKAATLPLLTDSILRIVEQAAKIDACFALEPVFVHTLGTVEKLRTLKEAVADHDHFHIIFDPVNVLTAADVSRQAAFWPAWCEVIGKDLACVHMKDAVFHPTRRAPPLPWARARWTTPSSANGSTATTPTPPYCGTRSSSPPRRPIWRISKPCKQIHRITVNKP